MMDGFKMNKSQSILITQMVLAILLTVMVGYLFAVGSTVPGELMSAWLIIIGFYFGNTAKINGAFSAGYRQAENVANKDRSLNVDYRHAIAPLNVIEEEQDA